MKKPFKSEKQIETVISEDINPITGKEAYILVNCVVDKRTCIVVEQ